MVNSVFGNLIWYKDMLERTRAQEERDRQRALSQDQRLRQATEDAAHEADGASDDTTAADRKDNPKEAEVRVDSEDASHKPAGSLDRSPRTPTSASIPKIVIIPASPHLHCASTTPPHQSLDCADKNRQRWEARQSNGEETVKRSEQMSHPASASSRQNEAHRIKPQRPDSESDDIFADDVAVETCAEDQDTRMTASDSDEEETLKWAKELSLQDQHADDADEEAHRAKKHASGATPATIPSSIGPAQRALLVHPETYRHQKLKIDELQHKNRNLREKIKALETHVAPSVGYKYQANLTRDLQKQVKHIANRFLEQHQLNEDRNELNAIQPIKEVKVFQHTPMSKSSQEQVNILIQENHMLNQLNEALEERKKTNKEILRANAQRRSLRNNIASLTSQDPFGGRASRTPPRHQDPMSPVEVDRFLQGLPSHQRELIRDILAQTSLISAITGDTSSSRGQTYHRALPDGGVSLFPDRDEDSSSRAHG
ncbi:hypothetical protein T440DRAFT_241787 [Plenodomus tracheiphilus IPT5]|uniref:Uncharacterized protein n=1 Tax=Plenodomus tracheiphilus IPT5 TaxID=1408161 RepID=A0A6A7BHJ7_9PLEO|nr:hypothetical protein T440DRAFT_241787 [Plenodomus tracheiphilus IPT5]